MLIRIVLAHGDVEMGGAMIAPAALAAGSFVLAFFIWCLQPRARFTRAGQQARRGAA